MTACQLQQKFARSSAGAGECRKILVLLFKDNFRNKVKSRLSQRYKNEHVLKILFWPLSPSAMAHTLSMERVSLSINPRLTYFLKKDCILLNQWRKPCRCYSWFKRIWRMDLLTGQTYWNEGTKFFMKEREVIWMCMRIILSFSSYLLLRCCKIAQRKGKTRIREHGQGDLKTAWSVSLEHFWASTLSTRFLQRGDVNSDSSLISIYKHKESH